MLDYRAPRSHRATARRCVSFATMVIGLLVCIAAPIAISIAGVYVDSVPFILIGTIVSGFLLASAMLFAAGAVERFGDLRD
jgi:hypothetical protein